MLAFNIQMILIQLIKHALGFQIICFDGDFMPIDPTTTHRQTWVRLLYI